MLSHIRSKVTSEEYRRGYDAIDWSQPVEDDPPRRGVRRRKAGGWDCGLEGHDHATFAEAAECVAQDGAKEEG